MKNDVVAVETLKRLGVPPCRIQVAENEPVPTHIIKHWKDKGIEVETTGVINVRFRQSSKVYIYPYRIKNEGVTGELQS